VLDKGLDKKAQRSKMHRLLNPTKLLKITKSKRETLTERRPDARCFVVMLILFQEERR